MDPPALTKWQYFWNVTWPDFWNSPTGKWVAVGLFVLSIILTPWLLSWTFFAYTFIYGATATFFAIGAIIAGLNSILNGNNLFDEFEDYINNNWAQSLAIISALYIVSMGVTALVKVCTPNVLKQVP